MDTEGKLGPAMLIAGVSILLLSLGFPNLTSLSATALPGPAPPAGTPVALVLYGNQCSLTNPLSGCAPRCTIYSCTVIPSASPSVMQGTTDTNGNVQLILNSYGDGSGSGFFPCSSGNAFVSWQFSPFYEGAAYLHGQWQLQSSQWQPGPAVYGCNPPVYGSSSPYQFQMPITDYVSNSTYYVNVTVCLVTCSSSPTYTVTTTNTATSFTTYTTTVTGTQGSTIFTTTATVTQPVTTVTQTTTTTGSTTATQTQTITKTVTGVATTRTVTQTVSTVGSGLRGSFWSLFLNIGMDIGIVLAVVGTIVWRKD